MKHERYYTDVGFISKGAMLTIPDTDGKYKMLIPVSNMPETKSAPNTQAKTVLSDGSITYTQGLQDNAQKSYTFNYHRDNIRALSKVNGQQLTFIEVNPDYTGEKFTGSITFGRSAEEVDGIVQGQIFITVTNSEELPLDDVRDLIKQTAIIESPLNQVEITGTATHTETIVTNPSTATVTVESSSTSVATVTIKDGVVTITGVATGNCLIKYTISATGEATSYRTQLVKVD